MVSLGFGKFARSDRIYALVPLGKEERGDGRRTRVWVEGIAEPVIASRTEVTILRGMGQEAAAETPLLTTRSTWPAGSRPPRTRVGSTSATWGAGLAGCWTPRPGVEGPTAHRSEQAKHRPT